MVSRQSRRKGYTEHNDDVMGTTQTRHDQLACMVVSPASASIPELFSYFHRRQPTINREWHSGIRAQGPTVNEINCCSPSCHKSINSVAISGPCTIKPDGPSVSAT